jgi:hypothetical protein
MAVAEWLDIKTLKLLSQHTSAVAGSAGSFYLISRMVRAVVGPGLLSNSIEFGEKFILTILLIWFTIEMLKLLWKGRVRFENGPRILSVVA